MTAPNRADLVPVLALCLWPLLCGEAVASGEALLIPVDGSIGVATGEMVERGLATSAEQGAELVILRLDTPGGLDTAMRRIIKAILASQIPVVGAGVKLVRIGRGQTGPLDSVGASSARRQVQ